MAGSVGLVAEVQRDELPLKAVMVPGAVVSAAAEGDEMAARAASAAGLTLGERGQARPGTARQLCRIFASTGQGDSTQPPCQGREICGHKRGGLEGRTGLPPFYICTWSSKHSRPTPGRVGEVRHCVHCPFPIPSSTSTPTRRVSSTRSRRSTSIANRPSTHAHDARSACAASLLLRNTHVHT